VHSAGSLFPLELFLHASRVAGLNSGVYHFNPPGDNLRFLRGGDQSQKLAPALMDGRLAQTAALIVFIAAMPERCVFRYGDRGYRFALLEAGAVVQNLNLIAGALGLACVNIGEYFDRQIDNILNLDGLTISILYMVAIGKPGGVEAAHSRGAGDGG
jgi:SagB-type dehydrogenase family enzyme